MVKTEFGRAVHAVLALTLAAGAWTTLTATTPASAADPEDPQGFLLATAWDGDGKAEAQGNIYWDATSPSFETVVRDVCPADGHAAYLSAQVHYMDGTAQWFPIGHDTNGCGPLGEVDVNKVGNGNRIKSVRIHLYEKNPFTGIVYGHAQTADLDNPTTG
jgi:hypothetical protein